MRRLYAIVLLPIVCVGCQPTTSAPATPAGSGAPAEATSGVAAAGSAAAAEPGRPDWTGPQPCEVDEQCRVFQPGDWSPEVECCYEYGCNLDYVAVNGSTVEQQRAWQRAHPFDCTEHLRQHGPCETRVPVCGLDQTPPPAACIENQCKIVYPDPWPSVVPDAQTCALDADCVPFRVSSTSLMSRCCGIDCNPSWVAVSASTLAEVQTWLSSFAPSCESWSLNSQCPQSEACAVTAPPVRCVAGVCALTPP